MSGDVAGDIFCGVLAGTLGKLVDYPLDTVKTRLQAPNSPYKGVFDCVWTTLRREGFIRGFYTGLPAAIVGAAAEKAVIFAAYNKGKQMYKNAVWGPDAPGVNDSDADTIAVCMAGGFVSGVPSAIISTPTELVKCRMQVHEGRWETTLDCARATARDEGALALFRGFSPCIVRELMGGIFWFGTFEILIRMALPADTPRSEASGWMLPLAGGTAGAVYWTVTYPLDAVKTRMQVDYRFYRMGTAAALQAMYDERGMRGIFRGWSVACGRKFVATGVVFSVYEVAAAKWRFFFTGQHSAKQPVAHPHHQPLHGQQQTSQSHVQHHHTHAPGVGQPTRAAPSP